MSKHLFLTIAVALKVKLVFVVLSLCTFVLFMYLRRFQAGFVHLLKLVFCCLFCYLYCWFYSFFWLLLFFVVSFNISTAGFVLSVNSCFCLQFVLLSTGSVCLRRLIFHCLFMLFILLVLIFLVVSLVLLVLFYLLTVDFVCYLYYCLLVLLICVGSF